VGVSFESLVFEILGKDTSGSAALDKFRRSVDQTSRSVDDNTGKLDKNAKSMDSLGKSAASATPMLGGLGGPGGMGLLIGAGVALSPVIATVATGLGGLGLAAIAVVKNQQLMAQTLKPLKSEYDAFAKALQPQVLGIFNEGIKIAGHLLKDIQPIAKATGVALGQVLGRVDAEFRSGTWQDFFQFMAKNAGPDIKLLGDLFVELMKDLPPLVEALQPVAVAFLQIAKGAGLALQAEEAFAQANSNFSSNQSANIKLVEQHTSAIGTFGAGLLDLVGDYKGAERWQQSFSTQVYRGGKLVNTASAANQTYGGSVNNLIHPIGTFTSGLANAKIATDNEKTAVTALTNALKGMGSGLLTTEQDQVAWKQAQQAATAAIKANTGSLNSNRATALTARAAIIQSTQAALAFANQEVNLHHNTDAASAILRAQIGWLTQHAGHSRIATAEVNALRAALAKLHNKAVTITETGTGHFSIFGRNTSSTPKLAGGAQGLFINRGTNATADDVLVRASKGELIVPTKMVSAGLVDHLRGMIPGFAAGGLAGLPGQTASFDHRFQSQFTSAMESAMTSAMRAAISAARAAARSAAFADTGARSGSAALAQSFARSILPRGWSFPALLSLWNQESGWNAYAVNASSGAYGIPQSLGHGHPYNLGDYKAQIEWGINYIAGRYGNSQGAWAHERAFNWYDRGGWLPPGPSLAYNGTGQPEQVLPGSGAGSMAETNALLRRACALLERMPAATSVGLGRALNGMVPR
jgi:hypothetical protein